jgi:pilus assembly protein CpaC
MRILFLWLLLHCTQSVAGELWLKVGEVRRVPAAGDAVVRIGARGVVRAIDSARGVQLVGLKPGATSLVIDDKSYLVRVSVSSQKDFSLALNKALRQMMGLKMHTDGSKLSITGTLLRFSDWMRIAETARENSGEYVFSAHALPDVAEEALKHFKGLATKRGFPILRFSADNGFRVHIPKSAQNLRASVEDIFKPFGIAVQMSESDLAIAPLVRTRVILAEVSKTFSQELGVKWPSEYEAKLLPSLKPGQDLMVTLRALESQGQAQILASPTLLCRSGSEAQFHAGGEFPVRLISRNSREVTWKKHGVILSVHPQADFQGAISLEVETEVSLLDMANAIDGVPSIKTNRVKSHFDLPGKRTIALSGLLRQELGESKEGLPFLSGIPVLGALFSSQKFLHHQTELVIFVTPEVHSAETDDPLEMPSGWVKNEF